MPLPAAPQAVVIPDQLPTVAAAPALRPLSVMGIGSWPRPRWMLAATHEHVAGRLSEADFQQTADDAVRLAQEPMVAWCHGAAGIGLSRLGMLSDPDTQTYQREIAVAVDTTLASGFGNNHCLCHGDLGNLDFLLQAAEALNHKAWNAAVQRLTRRILGEVERDGWRCGNNKPIDTPGLMTGLAGIGYGMLRLAAPHTVPPVTALRPPLITAPHACGAQRCRPHHAT